jgi:ketosteroid isomerase-like protein
MVKKKQTYKLRCLSGGWLFLLTAAVCVNVLGEAAVMPRQRDAEILRRIKTVDWPKAYRDQDVGLLNNILAEEFERIGDDGRRSSKRDEMEYIRKNRPSYSTFNFEITRLQVFENGTAVVSGVGDVRGRDAKGTYTTRYSSSNVFIKRGGGWKAVASHVSGVTTKYE